MKEDCFCQCVLRQEVSEKVYRQQTAWVPEQFAVPGRALNVREGDRWEEGWRVLAVYGRKSSDELRTDGISDRRARYVTRLGVG